MLRLSESFSALTQVRGQSGAAPARDRREGGIESSQDRVEVTVERPGTRCPTNRREDIGRAMEPRLKTYRVQKGLDWRLSRSRAVLNQSLVSWSTNDRASTARLSSVSRWC